MDKPSTTNAEKVPDELIDELHKANEHFHECKEQLEHALDGTEDRQQERVGEAEKVLRDAEKEVEGVEKKIHDTLKKPD